MTWDDIDLDAGTIRVSGAVVQDELHHFVAKATNKTATSTRTVPIMIPELRAALEAVPPEDRTGRYIEMHFKKKQAKTEFFKQVCLLFCLLFACYQKAARISPGGSIYLSHFQFTGIFPAELAAGIFSP